MSSEVQQEFETPDWTEMFIQEIQNRPALYNNSVPEHSDRKLVANLWKEVYEKMIPNWHKMSENEKCLRGKQLLNRWRNLRTCFRREIMKQRRGSPGPATYKRRTYVYYDQLLFLLSTMDDLQSINECSPLDVGEYNSENEDCYQFGQNLQDEESSKPQPSMSSYISPNTETNTTREKGKKDQSIDEDKLFLHSLVPSFRRLNEIQKIDVKIEFLSILKRFRQPNQGKFSHGMEENGTGPQDYIKKEREFSQGGYESSTSPPRRYD